MTAFGKKNAYQGGAEESRAIDVFLFWSEVPEDVRLAEILPRLDATERARAERFRFPRDRNAFAIAHALLRHALDAIAGVHPWHFAESSGGKPVIDAPGLPKLHFNLSHCRSMAAVAVCREAPVGVDVEVMDRTGGFEDMTSLVFAPSERTMLQSLQGDGWREAFFTLWTLKEAAIKATGQGLSADLPGFAFAVDPPRLLTAGPDGRSADEWRFFSARVADCRLAAALPECCEKQVAFHLSKVAVTDLHGA
jgi:4'-phosphopantetheinyl transferase